MTDTSIISVRDAHPSYVRVVSDGPYGKTYTFLGRYLATYYYSYLLWIYSKLYEVPSDGDTMYRVVHTDGSVTKKLTREEVQTQYTKLAKKAGIETTIVDLDKEEK